MVWPFRRVVFLFVLPFLVGASSAPKLDALASQGLLAPRKLLYLLPSSLRELWRGAFGAQADSLLINALMVATLATCVYQLRRWQERSSERASERSLIPKVILNRIGERAKTSDRSSQDPGLLRKHSTFKAYTTSVATYPAIRVFYRPHPQLDQLPSKPRPLPLLVFIHGLGGSVAQFHPLLSSLANSASCLAIDLPGCGLSEFSPQSWEAYSHAALVELLSLIIDEHCNQDAGQEVILLGHSMGCSLSVSLASRTWELSRLLKSPVAGIIAICPKASSTSKDQVVRFQRLLNIPSPVFDLWRWWDRRGGTESASVQRFLGANADLETKKLQIKYNQESRTGVFRRVARGLLPVIRSDGTLHGGAPGPTAWAGLDVPIFAIAGQNDHVTKPEELSVIRAALGRGLEDPTATVDPPEAPLAVEHSDPELSSQETSVAAAAKAHSQGSISTDATVAASDGPRSASDDTAPKRRPVLKTTILPPPATHALLYDQSIYRTLAGLIQTFLADHIDSRLSLGWQLQHLATEGKWEVKNLAKWQAVKPVSEPIHHIFRAMKTFRDVDQEHSPSIFVKNWSDKIKAIIDISHENPVYNPHTLDAGGVQYHKFPTVSKIPPTPEEVASFIALVDRLRSSSPADDSRLIGVHCHYGFNRTGFFICSYLIAKEGLTVQQAIDEFQTSRPPGIRHEHFVDTLWARYCVGLKRAPTM